MRVMLAVLSIISWLAIEASERTPIFFKERLDCTTQVNDIADIDKYCASCRIRDYYYKFENFTFRLLPIKSDLNNFKYRLVIQARNPVSKPFYKFLSGLGATCLGAGGLYKTCVSPFLGCYPLAKYSLGALCLIPLLWGLKKMGDSFKKTPTFPWEDLRKAIGDVLTTQAHSGRFTEVVFNKNSVT
jgi:hypothetical protein